MVTVHVIDLIPSVVWNLLPTIPTSPYTCVSPYIIWLLVSLRRRQIMILVPFQIRQYKVLFTLTFLPLQKSKLKSKWCQIRKPMDSISGVLIWNSIPLSIKTLLKNQFKRELWENSLKFWKKRTIILEFLILEVNSQNHNITNSLPASLTLSINHTTNQIASWIVRLIFNNYSMRARWI